jgi:hypothetical protein
MTTKLTDAQCTDAQLLILSAAAQREDRILAMPPKLKGGAAQKVAAKLIAAGLAKEIKAKRERRHGAVMPRSGSPSH